MLALHAFLAIALGVFLFYFGYLPDFLLRLNPSGIQETHTHKTQLRPPNPEGEQPASTSVQYVFEHAAVCSDSRECSEIGRDILQRGGSAVDAAIATLLCNGLLAMQSMGLGGGVIMNIYSKAKNQAYSILGREVAPLKLTPAAYKHLRSPQELLAASGLSIAVPTELLAYAEAHERFGILPWRDLMQRTVELCHAGYKLSKHQRDALQTNQAMLASDPLLAKTFMNATTGDFHRVGHHIRLPAELCRTYQLLAEDGPRSFYIAGQRLAKLVQADLKDLQTPIDQLDFDALKVAVVASKKVQFSDFHLHLPPPPSSGYIVGFIMNLLNAFAADFRKGERLGSREIHRIVEAFKFGFVKRWQLDIESEQSLIFNLTCPLYAQHLAEFIDDKRTHTHPADYGAEMELLARPDYGTAHISVLGPNGDAVSATSSINFYFGSGRTGPRTGIVFNNALADFSIKGLRNYFDLPLYAGRNALQPGRSPMSSMAPLIVTDANGGVRLIVGAAGGTKIITALTQILVRTLWLGQSIKEAIDSPRFHHQLLPNVLEYEYGIVQPDIDALERRGHETKRYRDRGSSVCGIEQIENTIQANADYRKEGGVAGF